MLKVGTQVTIVTPVPKGEIKGMKITDDQTTLLYLVEFVGTDGETHQRWCDETQLAVAA